MMCYKIIGPNGNVHYTDQETELGIFARKYGWVNVSWVNYCSEA
jgi:hypothetical protein